ncbi:MULTISPECIES: hypothetical protein [Sorangium]|nr:MULTISPECIES: hypothetical protein [Sorangium]
MFTTNELTACTIEPSIEQIIPRTPPGWGQRVDRSSASIAAAR